MLAIRSCAGTGKTFNFKIIDNLKGHVETNYVTKFDAFRLNSDQAMGFEPYKLSRI